MGDLVLSCFSGVGLLDRAFEDESWCVVRGPDPVFGGDIRSFHPTRGVWGGVIGGPPCQPFSRLVHMVHANGYQTRHENLIPELERVIDEAQPEWFLMEEVPAAPLPSVPGYIVWSSIVNNRWFGGAQERKRRISFGTRDGRPLCLEVEPLESGSWEPVVSSHAKPTPVALAPGGKRKPNADRAPRSIGEMLMLQDFPSDYLDDCPLTESGKRTVVGNGVPRRMGRAIARAVRRAVSP